MRVELKHRSMIPGTPIPQVVAALAATFLMGCSDTPTTPAERRTANLQITVETVGGDPDVDGYDVLVGSAFPLRFPPQGSVFLKLEPGTYVLTLMRVAENCTVTAPHPLTVTLQAGATTDAKFRIACVSTGISVKTRTTGSDQPLGLQVYLGDILMRFVEVNDSILINRLRPDRYSVRLGGLTTNCRTTSDNPVVVDLAAGQTAPLVFEINCTRTEKRIAFVLDSAFGPSPSWVQTADVDGSGVTTITAGVRASWAPHGRELVVASTYCDYYYGYCVGGVTIADPDTRRLSVLSTGSLGIDPAWSPDGTLIVFSRPEKNISALHMIKPDGSPAMRLDLPAVLDVRRPAWAPNGQQIAFQCSLSVNDYDICVVNTNGTGFRQLTSGSAVDVSPAWSPDGGRIAFSTTRFSPQFTIALMSPTGADITRLMTGFDPAWSPDGSKIMFAGADGLFTAGVDGSNVTRITRGRHRAPVWRP